MTGHIARKVVQFFNQRGGADTEVEKLSNREREVLEHLARGVPYKEIASVLAVSIDTVRVHIKGIYGKLHVHSRGEAVAKYLGPECPSRQRRTASRSARDEQGFWRKPVLVRWKKSVSLPTTSAL